MTLDELRQLDPRDPGRWPLPVRLATIGIFFVVLSAFLLFFLVWRTHKEDLARYETEEIRLREEFRTKHAKAVNLDLYKQQLDDIQTSFGTMLRQLPGRKEVESLLVDISQTGLGAGLQQQLFQTLPEQNRDFYAELPYKLRLVGSYHQMGEFVSGIAALPRIVTLHDFSIKAPERSTGGPDQLQLEVTAKTYRYLDDEEIAAVDAARQRNQTTRRRSSP